MDKSFMFWGQGRNGVYGDGVPVPRVTYRCKGSVKLRNGVHSCKLVTDHEEASASCICLCGVEFNKKEE